MVIRTYPIRVADNSGPMHDEISWQVVTEESKSPTPISESTTVTKKTRRVGRFDMEMVKRAAMINRPTQIALNFIDYISYENKEKRVYSKLTNEAKRFIKLIETETGIPVTFIGTGPNRTHIIDLRSEKLLQGHKYQCHY
jgi:adenylosuccinate synthase